MGMKIVKRLDAQDCELQINCDGYVTKSILKRKVDSAADSSAPMKVAKTPLPKAVWSKPENEKVLTENHKPSTKISKEKVVQVAKAEQQMAALSLRVIPLVALSIHAKE
jgi:hypothetical protein